jgi:hypothetical protein
MPTNSVSDVVRWLMGDELHRPLGFLNQNFPPPEPLTELASKPILTITQSICYIADIKTGCLREDDRGSCKGQVA